MTAAHFRYISRAKFIWNGILNWGKKRVCFYIYTKGTLKDSDSEIGLFLNFKKWVVLEIKWFFVHFVISWFDAVVANAFDAMILECDTRPGGQGTRNET